MKFIGLHRTSILYITFILLMVLIPSVMALPALQEQPPCEGYPECYEEPPPETTSVPEPDNPPSESSWEGFSDGRLNPAMDEYYTVYCVGDQLELWRGVPTGSRINDIPIQQLVYGPFPFDDGFGHTVNRAEDTITISGSDGNGPNHPGSKSFSLAECIARNGGEPPPNPAENPPPAENNSSPPADAEEAASTVSLCLVGNESLGDFIECLNFFTPDNPSSSFVYVISGAIATFCAGGVVPFALVASLPTIRRWRRRKRQ